MSREHGSGAEGTRTPNPRLANLTPTVRRCQGAPRTCGIVRFASVPPAECRPAGLQDGYKPLDARSWKSAPTNKLRDVGRILPSRAIDDLLWGERCFGVVGEAQGRVHLDEGEAFAGGIELTASKQADVWQSAALGLS